MAGAELFVPFALGRYTVVNRIRYGGMGEVLLGRRMGEDGALSSWAIKRPLPTVMEDPELLSLFWKETELAQKMQTPAFPRIEEVGVSQGIPFMVMELVVGASVQEILSKTAGSLLRPECWVLLASDLAAAVGELHKFRRGTKSLVHGDIRSRNVMVDTEGTVRLLDMGLAMANETLWRRVLRCHGPEIPLFLRDRDKGPEFDVWSIARLLVECLGGPTNLGGRTRLPPGLSDVLGRCLDSSGLHALRTARTLRWSLNAYLAQSKVELMRQELAQASQAAYSPSPAARPG